MEKMPLKINLLKQIAIPMYGKEPSTLKKYIIKSKKRIEDFVKKANHTEGMSALVCSGEWYELNKDYCHDMIKQHLPSWTKCRIWRDLYDVGIVAVLALKRNSKPSSRINKRVVDRAYAYKCKPICSYTRESLEREDASAEHIIPLGNGGNNSVWNICVAHHALNNDRGLQNFWKFWRTLISSSL